MKAFIKHKWTIIGLFLVAFGWGPFLVALMLRISGSRSNFDLTGLGLLFFATFWPAIVCFALAIALTMNKRKTKDSCGAKQ